MITSIKLFVSALSLPRKIGGIATLIALLSLGKCAYDTKQQNIGAEKLQTKIEKVDKKTLEKKEKNDVEIRSKSDNDLIDELVN